jgi:hypothetical protein
MQTYERPTLTKAGKFAEKTTGRLLNRVEFFWPRQG